MTVKKTEKNQNEIKKTKAKKVSAKTAAGQPAGEANRSKSSGRDKATKKVASKKPTSQKKIPEKDEKGQFAKGNKGGPGRPKGSGGKQQLVKMVLEAVEQRGGAKWMAGLDDKLFVKLVVPLLDKKLLLDLGRSDRPVILKAYLAGTDIA